MEEKFTKTTQETIENFIDEVYLKPPKNNYPTNKTDVYQIDEIWSLDTLDLRNYEPENNRNYSNAFVVIDSFSNFGLKVPLKNAQKRKILLKLLLYQPGKNQT